MFRLSPSLVSLPSVRALCLSIGFCTLVSGIVSAEEEAKEPLTFGDLIKLNESLGKLDQFEDNEFVYNEKLSEFLAQAQKFVGLPVRLIAEVDHVTTRRVVARPKSFAEIRRAVRFSLMRDGSKDSIGTIERSYAYLTVGDFVELEMAKRLRKGDELVISGELRQVTALRRGLPNPRTIPGLEFQIGKPMVEQTEEW